MRPPQKFVMEKDTGKTESQLNNIFTDIYKRFGVEAEERPSIPIKGITTGDVSINFKIISGEKVAGGVISTVDQPSPTTPSEPTEPDEPTTKTFRDFLSSILRR